MKKFDLIIIDLDGTLLDSNDLWISIDEQFCLERNLTMPDDYLTNLARLGMKEGAKYTRELFKLDMTSEQIEKAWDEKALAAYNNEVAIKDGAREVLEAFKKEEIRMVVGTMNSRRYFDLAMERLDLYKYFDFIYSADNQDHGKSTRKFYDRILEDEGLEASRILVIDDLLDACKSAKETGMKVCFMEDKVGVYERQDLEKYSDYQVTKWEEVLNIL